jgi:hypothetical protein
MATADEYAAWIVQNRAKRGTSEYDVVVQAYEEAKLEEGRAAAAVQPGQAMPAPQRELYVAPPAVRPAAPTTPPTMGQRIVGAGETALSLLTGAVGAPLGMIQGTGAGLAREILSGQFGTPAAAQRIEQAAAEQAARFTYAPRTAAGQEMLGAVGETLQQVAPPVLPQIAAPGMAIQAATQQAPLVATTAGRVAAAAAPATRAVVQAPARAARAAGRAIGMLPPEQADMDAVSRTASALQRGSAGAAGVPMAAERAARAEMMPVPFTGPSALTAGQATRNFAQLQFEKEAAKLGDVGAPLRERVETQTANMIRNFDALIDMPNPVAADPRAMGMGVDRALVNRVEVQRRKVRDAYDRARTEGAMQAPVEMVPLATQLSELQPLEGLVGTIPAVRREAVRLGVLAQDENGNLLPQTTSLENSELLRQFVNANTDWTDRREALIGRRINGAIDSATEGVGGDAYRAARRQRQRFAEEFENVGLTAKLLGTKRGTDERQVAFGDVFDKVVLTAPVEEMNKLRSTLLRAGPEGQQAWSDLKSGGIRFIKDASLSPSQRDASGNPLLSPDKLQRTVRSFDQDGKLEALYGKRQAQVLRDLAELASDIYTAPPGAINTSNTASALQVAMDSLVTFGATGVPAPAMTALKEATKYVKNRKTKARIEAALRGQVTAAE